MKVGIIGCGNISSTYFNCSDIFNNIEIIACADIDTNASNKSAKQYNLKAQSVEEILNNKDIELIVNLTIPSAHKEIISKCIESGKHCFSEKPLAMNFKEGDELKKFANKKNIFIACAPDTFLGAAGQKARELIDQNKIGNICLGTFNMMSHGMEHWHPNPDFFFKPGAGPIFDLGVYYITQLVNLIGPVKKIISVSSTVQNKRTITSNPRYGEKIKVETPTTLMAVLEFTNSIKVQLFASWDVWKHSHSSIELYGSNGSMILPDPNFFGGNILVSEKDYDWNIINTETMLLGKPNHDDNGVMRANYRGIGLCDMINSIAEGREPRCSINLALHVLEVMEGIITSSNNSSTYTITTVCKKPEPFIEKEILKLKYD